MKIQISTTVLFFVLFALTHVELFAQVPEIPRPYLRGFARVSAIRGQPVIYYNPVAIRRVGPQVSQFILSLYTSPSPRDLSTSRMPSSA